ncbi:hypothetical protein ACJX0J_027163, partial [Zea mays]
FASRSAVHVFLDLFTCPHMPWHYSDLIPICLLMFIILEIYSTVANDKNTLHTLILFIFGKQTKLIPFMYTSLLFTLP